MRKKLLWAVLIAILCYSPAFAQEAKKTWKIFICRAELLIYSDIESGLKTSIAALGHIDDQDISYLPTKIVGDKSDDYPQTQAAVKEIIANNKPDIIVTIGTPATIPIWQVVKDTNIPVVFSSVTYPIREGLIEALGKPTGKNITGITVGVPQVVTLAFNRQLLPDRNKYKRLAYLYSSENLADVAYMEGLKSLPTTSGWKIIYIDYYDNNKKAISYDLLFKKIKEIKPDAMFGYATLSLIRSNPEPLKKLHAFNIPVLGIASMDIDPGVVGGIMSDYKGLGKQQAEMVDKILKGEKAGNIPPAYPKTFMTVVNLKRAHELGIEPDPKLVADANKIIPADPPEAK